MFVHSFINVSDWGNGGIEVFLQELVQKDFGEYRCCIIKIGFCRML